MVKSGLVDQLRTWAALVGVGGIILLVAVLSKSTEAFGGLSQERRVAPGSQVQEKEANEKGGNQEDGEENDPGGLRIPPRRGDDLPDLENNDPLGQPGRNVPQPGMDDGEGQRPPQNQDNLALDWPFHFTFQFESFDGILLGARYFPSESGVTAPVVLLLHEPGAGRSSQDFESEIEDLDDLGLALHLQDLGYAVLAIDLRGHGQSQRGRTRDNRQRTIADIQVAYRFLIDRHNRGELNLAKFGVLAIGEAANLAATWAVTPQSAVAIQGRPSDLASLVLIAPAMAGEEENEVLTNMIERIVDQVPVLIEGGKGDPALAEFLTDLQPILADEPQSEIAPIDARIGGINLVRFAPAATTPILNFLDNTLQIRTDEWEPRFNLQPITYGSVEPVQRPNVTNNEEAGVQNNPRAAGRQDGNNEQ